MSNRRASLRIDPEQEQAGYVLEARKAEQMIHKIEVINLVYYIGLMCICYTVTDIIKIVLGR